MAAKQTTRAAGESVLFLALIGAILVVANVVATGYNIGRFDLTRNHLYSLSRGSENVVHRLDDTLTVRAYFTENLPAEFADTERQVRDLLSEYKAVSRGRLVVRYIRPDNEDRQEQAERDGVQKVQHTVFRNDAREQVDGYRGIALEYRGETKAIPVIAGSEGLEYQITMLIRQMIGDRRKIGVVSNHGWTQASGGMNGLKTFLPNYEFVDVDATQPIASDVRALLLIGPNSALSDAELRNIDAYVMHGGSLGVFGGSTKPVEGALGSAATVEPIDSGVNRLLEHWGVTVESDVLADARCLPRVREGMGGMPQQEPYPVWAVAPFEEDARNHPASYQLDQAFMLYTSTLKERSLPSGVTRRVLARSSRQSWELTGSPINVDPGDWQSTVRQPFGPFPLVVALEGRLPSAFASVASTDPASEQQAALSVAEHPVRVLVTGTAALFHEQFIPPPEQLTDPRVAERALELIAFSLNSIDWLANDSDLIAIRSKTIEAPMLDQMRNIASTVSSEQRNLDPRDRSSIERARARIEAMQAAFERKKKAYRWGMTLGIPLLVVAFGVLRWQMRKRMKASLSA